MQELLRTERLILISSVTSELSESLRLLCRETVQLPEVTQLFLKRGIGTNGEMNGYLDLVGGR